MITYFQRTLPEKLYLMSVFSLWKKNQPLNYCKHKGDYSLCVFSQLVYFKEKVSYIYIHRFLLKSKASHTIFISTEKNCPELKCKSIELNLWWIPQHYEMGKVTVNPNCKYVRPPVWMKLITSLGEHFTYFHLFDVELLLYFSSKYSLILYAWKVALTVSFKVEFRILNLRNASEGSSQFVWRDH